MSLKLQEDFHPYKVYRLKDKWVLASGYWDYTGWNWTTVSLHDKETEAEKEARRLIDKKLLKEGIELDKILEKKRKYKLGEIDELAD